MRAYAQSEQYHTIVESHDSYHGITAIVVLEKLTINLINYSSMVMVIIEDYLSYNYCRYPALIFMV